MGVGVGERAVDARASRWLADADPGVRRMWESCLGVAAVDPPAAGLSAGDRPIADVEVLAGAVAAAEYALAARLYSATTAGAVPFTSPGGMLRARGWSTGAARRLARCGALAARHAGLADAWAAGLITAEHVDAIARVEGRFGNDELSAIIDELAPRWGHWSPAMIARFVAAAERMLHPPPEPTPDEADAYQSRALSFAVLGDTVLLSGQLPRVEGEAVIAAIDALADRLRSTADPVPAGARRADALVQLVNEAHAADLLPSRGGLPVSLTVTLDRTALGDAIWTTSRGHILTDAEARWSGCDAALTPILIERDGNDVGGSSRDRADVDGLALGQALEAPRNSVPPVADRIAALAAALFDTRIPLDVGRTARTATPAQRRALASRDRGCIIPGCGAPAESCQTHHLREWANGGATEIDNLVLLCWAHHRQVDLNMWTIRPSDSDGTGTLQPAPGTGLAAGTSWSANNGAPFTVERVPRGSWRIQAE